MLVLKIFVEISANALCTLETKAMLESLFTKFVMKKFTLGYRKLVGYLKNLLNSVCQTPF
jgi:hypothetical protein